jgi:hypothetical protein
MACLTGVGANLLSSTAGTKFTSSENWLVTGIRGAFGRSVVVIDDSDLQIAKGRSKQYCFGDLYELRPVTVECKADPDDSNVWDDVTDNGSTTVHDVPVVLGDLSGTNPTFVLTMPTNQSTACTCTFTGAIVDDSGVDLVNNDRPRITFQIQPDGGTFTWSDGEA